MPFVFIPSIAEQILNVLIKNKEKLSGKDLVWWTKNSPFQMDAGLLSAYYLYMRKGEDFSNFRQEMKFPDSKLFMLDSGGFELYSQQNNPDPTHQFVQKNLTPEKIIKIQEAVADIGLVLDRPPYETNRVEQDNTFFKSSMEFTKNNTGLALKYRTNPHLKLYGVLHGSSYELITLWYDVMKKYPVDGWSVVPYPEANFKSTALFISFILEQHIDIPVHFLGISGFNSLALIIYLLRNDQNGLPYFNNLITSDSTSYNIGARMRAYTLPGDFRSKVTIGQIENKYETNEYGHDIISSKSNSQALHLTELPCECPVCSLTDINEMRSATNVGGLAASLHNLYQQKILIKVLTSLTASPDDYKSYVLKYNTDTKRKEINDLFDLIDGIISYQREYSPNPCSWLSQFGASTTGKNFDESLDYEHKTSLNLPKSLIEPDWGLA